MGNLRACFAVATLALAACGSDHAAPDASIKIIDAPPPDMKVWEDAPPPMYDFSCMGNTAPTTANANITLSGSVQRASFNGSVSIDPLAGAALKACKAGASTCTGQNQYGMNATSAADGSWSIGPFATGGTPVDGYVEMTETTSRTTYVFPPSPLTADQGMIPVLTFDPQFIALLGAIPGGCTQNDTANGMIVLAVTDCANAPIGDTANLTIEIKQGGTPVSGTTVIDLGQLQQEAAGTFFVCNVPENATTEVGASYKTMALRAHDVKVVKATTTATILRPGY
jgi:hypothetical protein